MFDDDNKRIATAILSKRKPSGERISMAPMKTEVVKTEDGEPDGRHLAAQDMMSAIHEKSPQKFSEALKNFIAIHHSMSDEPMEDQSGN